MILIEIEKDTYYLKRTCHRPQKETAPKFKPIKYMAFGPLTSIFFVERAFFILQNRCFSRVTDSSHHKYLGSIDEVPWVEKHKFPLQYFPESRWSRKGYLRTRWRFSPEAILDLVNIHLFHDASNLKSVESVPSIYVNYRKRALCYTLDRIGMPIILKFDF